MENKANTIMFSIPIVEDQGVTGPSVHFLTGDKISRTSTMLPCFLTNSSVNQPSLSENPMASIWSNALAMRGL